MLKLPMHYLILVYQLILMIPIYIFFEDKKVKNALIVLYHEMLYNGFVLTDYGEKLKDEWKTKIYEKSIVFSNYRTFILHEL